MYKLVDVSFNYNKWVLRNINLDFEKGKFYSIVGPNGAGKTTLLYILSRFLKPKTGIVYLQNKPLNQFKRKQLSKIVSIVTQEYIRFNYTVWDIVSMGRYPYKKGFNLSKNDFFSIEEALSICGLDQLKNENILNLSSGEHQRALIARTIAQNTPVLLLDEAFANLDLKYTAQILETLLSLKKTIVSVFHDISLAKMADYIIFLKNGQVQQITQKNFTISTEFLEDFFDIKVETLNKLGLYAF